MKSTKRVVILSILLVCSSVIAACQATPKVEKVPLLASAPSEITPSRYVPSNPFKPIVPGLLGRVAYIAENNADNYSVQVLDLMIGPSQSSAPHIFDGEAILEVRAGVGTLMVDGDRTDIRIGNVVPLASGSEFSIENGSEAAIQIRAHVVVDN
jgi:hypothetical protein